MGRRRGPGAAPQHAARRQRHGRAPPRRPAPGDRRGPLPPRLRPAPRPGEPDRGRPEPRHRLRLRRHRPRAPRGRCAASSTRRPDAGCSGTSRSATGPASSLDHIDDPATRRLVEAAFDGFEERVAPTWAALRAQVVHGDLTLDNLLIDDGAVTGVLDLGDLTHSTLVFDIAAAFGSLGATLQGDDALPHPAPVPRRLSLGDAAGARGAGRARRHDRHPRRDDAVHLALAGRRPSRERGVHPGLGRDLAQPAAAVRGARPRGGHPAARRARRAAGHRRAASPSCRGVRHRAGPADVRRAAAPGQRQRRHA